MTHGPHHFRAVLHLLHQESFLIPVKSHKTSLLFMVSFQFDEQMLVRCGKRRKKEGEAGIWWTVMLLSIATSRTSASCTEKAWGSQSLYSVVLMWVVSPSYIFAHEIGTIFTALFETLPLHSLLWIAFSLGILQHPSSILSMHFYLAWLLLVSFIFQKESVIHLNIWCL